MIEFGGAIAAGTSNEVSHLRSKLLAPPLAPVAASPGAPRTAETTKPITVDDRESEMLSILHKALFSAIVPLALFLTTDVDSPVQERSLAESHATNPLQLDAEAWIDVRRLEPIHSVPRLDTDVQLGRVAANVADFTQSAGGIPHVDAQALADHLEGTLPNASVSLSSTGEEYFYYIDQNGKLVRVCVSNAELTVWFDTKPDPVIVSVRNQLQI